MTLTRRYILARLAFALLALAALPGAALAAGYFEFAGALLQLWLALPVLLLLEYGSWKVLGPNRIGLRKHLDGLPLWVFIAVVCLGIGLAVFAKQAMPHLVWLQVAAALVCVFGIFELTDKFICFRPFPKVGVVVTNELINQIKDQEGL